MQVSGWCCIFRTILQIWLIFLYACTYHLFAGTWSPLVSVITTLYYVATIMSRSCDWRILGARFCGIAHFLCAMHVFVVRASSSSPRLPFAKFRYCRGLHCSASPWRKITYSITQSLNYPAYLMCLELKLALRKTTKNEHLMLKQTRTSRELTACSDRRTKDSQPRSLTQIIDLSHAAIQHSNVNWKHTKPPIISI